MYFNLWNNYFYYKTSIFVVLAIFLTILISTYIIIKGIGRYLKNQKQKKELFMNIDGKSTEEKFKILKKIFNLNSSYQIASFINLDINKTEKLIKQNQIGQIIDLILKTYNEQ